MRTTSRTLALLAFLLSPGARSDAPTKPASSEDLQVVHLQDLQWTPSKLKEVPAGALAAVVAADPQTGGTVGYGKLPGGSTIPAHWHSFTEYTVLLSGKAALTVDGKTYETIPAELVVKAGLLAGAQLVGTQPANPWNPTEGWSQRPACCPPCRPCTIERMASS